MERHRLTAAQAGDQDAQRELLREVGPSLAALARRAGGTDAEDRLHELFAHLLAVLPRFKPEGPAKLSTWAFTVAHRWLLMNARRKVPQLVALEGGLAVADRARSPEAHAEHRQLAEQLDAALAQLPEEQRRAFVLTQLFELPLDVVASSENVPVGTLKSRLHRARAALVLLLGEALDRQAPEGGRHAARR